MSENRRSVKGIIMIVSCLVLVAAAAFIIVYASGSDEREAYSEKMTHARECMESKDYDGAEIFCKRALDIFPESEEAYMLLADVYRAQLNELKQQEQINNERLANRTDIDMEVRQIDKTSYPKVTMYVSVTDKEEKETAELTKEDIIVDEYDYLGTPVSSAIGDMHKVRGNEGLKIALLFDSNDKCLEQEEFEGIKRAAASFAESINVSAGDEMEIFSFDEHVFLMQPFTSDIGAIHEAIDAMKQEKGSELCDAIYASLLRIDSVSGEKAVIVITSGEGIEDNEALENTINTAKAAGVPIFVIETCAEGEQEEMLLRRLAIQCGGKHYMADEDKLENSVRGLLKDIYETQKNCYSITFNSIDNSGTDEFRAVRIMTSDDCEVVGECFVEYVPKADLTDAFSSEYNKLDYIIEDSDERRITDADLEGFSLAALRIARNEIFARHGRQFKDPFLNRWFCGKEWYLDIKTKYTPDEFSALKKSPLTGTENKNVDFILEYENRKMITEDIFPNASYILLSEYDLALSKDVLQRALTQMQQYPVTDTYIQNCAKILEILEQEEIQY